jgi:Carboxypeptidase regulatory-like domain
MKKLFRGIVSGLFGVETVSPGAGLRQGLPARSSDAFARSATLALFLCVALIIGRPLSGQVENGTIIGRVTDPGGAVVPGAAVTVTQGSTGLLLHGTTNSDGTYSFPQLQPSPYTVSVEKPGFKKTEASVTLTVGQVARLDISLPVGNETEVVNVEANNAAQLETQSSSLDYTVGTRQVDELPLNGRNAYGLAALTPGIAPGNYFGQGLSTTRGAVVAAATNNFETNGGIGGSNEVLLDGVSIVVCCQGQPAATPTLEILGQFKVLTSDPPASYGHTSGGILNIVTKSGTNQLHGDLYEFFRNDALDAANFFTKRSGIYPFPGRDDYTLPHRFNQFGGFAGGPVVLPHLYHGKDKTFFLFGYEGTRNFAPVYTTVTVPTNLMRQGIFTEAPLPIYNPTTYNSTTGLRTLIPAACNGPTCYSAGEYIPNIDPVAQKLLALIPAPNASGVANNYGYPYNVNDTENQFNFRVDHNFSANQRSFVRGTRDVDVHHQNGLFNMPLDPNAYNQALTAYLFALGHVWTVSPSLLLQFSYGFAFQSNSQLSDTFYNYNPANYGFSSLFTSQQQTPGLPNITFTGLETLGEGTGGTGFNLWHHYVHSLNATAIWQRGNHTFTIGYNGKMVLENQGGLGNPSGTFNFTTTFANGPNPNTAVPSAQSAFDSWASFLLGYPGSGSIERQETVAFNQFYNASFLQDDWRMTPRLTLNLGVRWDVETGFKERYNRWADFNPTVSNPLSAYTGLSFTGGAQYLGVSGNPSRTWSTAYAKVAPRVGFSYAATPTTVVRAGYGILYLPTSERGYGDATVGFSQTTNMLTTVNGFTPVNTLDNPFPSGVLLPAGAAAGVTVSTGSTVSGFLYHTPVSYEQQWNGGLEQDLGKGVVLNLNYGGSHGVKLPQNLTPNDLQPQYFGSPGNQTQVAYLQALVPNPFYGSSAVAAGSVLANSTVQRAQLVAAFPQYATNTNMQNSSLTYLFDDRGSVSYNAMQISIIVNHPNGLSGSVAYTWSKLLGDVTDLTNGFLNQTGNPGFQDYYFIHQYERSNLATDIPQRLVGNLTYALPFGRGKMFGSNMPGWANEIAGGWNLTSITAVQSGFPLGLTQTGGQPFSGGRPSYVPGVAPLTPGSAHRRLGSGGLPPYFNSAAFRLSQSFQLGDVPRSAAALRSPLTFQDDISAVKNFGIHENLTGEFRLEAFNFLNKVQFGFPGTVYGSSTFGDITSQENLPRNVQAALKIHF